MNIRRIIILGLAYLMAIQLNLSDRSANAAEEGTVFYAGATGSIGRIAIDLLNERGYAVRGMTRNPVRAARLYGNDYDWVRGDVRDPDEVLKLMEGADFVICSISYTEFEGPNSPQFVDYMGVRNLVDAAKALDVKHFVLISAGSSGPLRDHTQNPRFGYVAYWKTKGEDYLKTSGVSFTIVGPTGFVDGPGGELGIRIVSRTEYKMGTIRRSDVAAVTVEALNNPDAIGKSFFVENSEAGDKDAWSNMFKLLQPE